MGRYLLIFHFALITSHGYSQTNEEKFSLALHDYLSKSIPSNEPGMAVLIAKPNDHKIFSRGYGMADMNKLTPITPNTIFNLGSVSKTFVGYGILKLQEQGKLSIEDPILKYFPNFKNKELVKNIRLIHLLSHCSGLPDNRTISRDSVFYLTANDEQNWAPILQNDSLNFQPGERFQYSNPAFNGLALVIEKVTGIKWQEFIQQIIFDKAGMRTSVITDIEYPQLGVAHGYQKINNQWQEYDFGEYPTFCAAGNGGVWSSVEELLKYEEAIQKYIIVNKELVDMSRTIYAPPNWRGKMAPYIGVSWFIVNDARLKMIWHSGDQAGFRAEHRFFPDSKLFIAVIGNGNRELDETMEKIVELLRSHQLLSPITK